MRPVRLVVYLFLFGLLAAPSGTSRTASADVATLAGDTVVSGTGSVHQAVVVPADTVVTTYPLFNRTIIGVGDARLSGLVLVSRTTREAVLGVVRDADLATWCIGPYCGAPMIVVANPSLSEYPYAEIPAGEYDLEFFAQGGSASFRLLFDGLQGSVSLQPSEPMVVDARTIVPEFGVPTSLWWGGGTGSTGAGGFRLSAVWWKAAPNVYTEMGFCLYDNRAPTVDTLSYAPGCPTADYEVIFGGLLPAAEAMSLGYSWNVKAAGISGLGWWLAGAVTRGVGGVNVWIEYPESV